MNYCTRFFAVAFLSMITVWASCTKKGDNTKLQDENEPVSEFMPTTPGSWWMYASNEGDVTIRRATGRDSVKEDRTYSYFETTDTVSAYVTPEYFGKNGDLYIMLIDVDGSQENYYTVVVQKENAEVGNTWSNTGSITYAGNKFNLLTEGEVVSTGGTLTINGKTYTDVVEIKNKLKAKHVLMPNYVSCGTAVMWFSKGVGIVKTIFDISIMDVYKRKYTDSLLDYHIEK